MQKQFFKEPVKGGWVKRESRTGAMRGAGTVIEVQGPRGVSKATKGTQSVVEKTAEKRHAALKRLADR